MVSRRSMADTSPSGNSTPSSADSRPRLRSIAPRSGRCFAETESITGPGFPPAAAMISSVARSIASTWPDGSTPRSNRSEASVCSPSLRALPATAPGAKNADSSKTLVVPSPTALAIPPMIPAAATACFSSAITSTSESSFSSVPSSRVSDSPGFAQRAQRSPFSRSRS